MNSVLAVGTTDVLPSRDGVPAAGTQAPPGQARYGAIEPATVLSRRERNGLVGLVLGAHVALFLWLILKPESVLELTPPDIPEMTIELSPATPRPPEPTPPPPPPPPPPRVTPPPVARATPVPAVDELATKPAPPKPVVQEPVPTPAPPPPPTPAPAPPAPAKPAAVTPPLAYADYLRNPAPEYPEQALRRGWEGTVLLRVHVLASGRPGNIEIERSSGREMLDRAAVRTVQKWTFVPAKRGNEPQDGWVTVPIDFKLQ